jgi:hypothetical protein
MDNYEDLVLHEKLYFIHIPKTSGTSLQSNQIIKLGHNFNVPNIYRTPASKGGYIDYLTDYWDVYQYNIKPNNIITIIRNPFDLLTSYYFHGEVLRSHRKYIHNGWGSVNLTHQFKSFKEFIIAYCYPHFKWHQPAFKNFLFSQLFDINHKCVSDIIIKYEYLDEAIDILNKKLKYPIQKQTKNITRNKQKNYKEYYDEEMIELVKKKCSRELEYFHYDFHGSTKHEPLIINCNLMYDVYNDKIIHES